MVKKIVAWVVWAAWMVAVAVVVIGCAAYAIYLR